jgi:hypothetical protein
MRGVRECNAVLAWLTIPGRQSPSPRIDAQFRANVASGLVAGTKSVKLRGLECRVSHPRSATRRTMLRAARKNFEEAYRRHLAASAVAAERQSVSHVLLLVYAIECGIKALLLRKLKARSWDELHPARGCGPNGHDLAEGLKNLGVSARLTISRRRTAPDRDGRQEDVTAAQLHEACRYAIPLEDSDFPQMRSQLDAILTWLRTQLGG